MAALFCSLSQLYDLRYCRRVQSKKDFALFLLRSANMIIEGDKSDYKKGSNPQYSK